MAMHSIITPAGIEAGAPHPDRVFPRFKQVEPIPGIATSFAKMATLHDPAETAAAMNAVQVALNAILAEGGAHA